MTKSNFGKVARLIKKAIDGSAKKALSKAITATNTRVKKQLRSDTGLTSKVINKRVFAQRPKQGSNKYKGSVITFTKFGVQLSEFKPKEKIVRGTNGRRYNGVTVKIGKGPRQLVPGGFLAVVRSGKALVLKRKGTPRYPTQAPTTDIVYQSAKANQAGNVKYLRDTFTRLSQEEIDKALDKKLK